MNTIKIINSVGFHTILEVSLLAR